MAVCVMGRVCVFLYAGIIFNTRVVVGSLCVGCGEVSAFVVGLLFSTRVVGGADVCVAMGRSNAPLIGALRD